MAEIVAFSRICRSQDPKTIFSKQSRRFGPGSISINLTPWILGAMKRTYSQSNELSNDFQQGQPFMTYPCVLRFQKFDLEMVAKLTRALENLKSIREPCFLCYTRKLLVYLGGVWEDFLEPFRRGVLSLHPSSTRVPPSSSVSGCPFSLWIYPTMHLA